jgi:hypothetical protein
MKLIAGLIILMFVVSAQRTTTMTSRAATSQTTSPPVNTGSTTRKTSQTKTTPANTRTTTATPANTRTTTTTPVNTDSTTTSTSETSTQSTTTTFRLLPVSTTTTTAGIPTIDGDDQSNKDDPILSSPLYLSLIIGCSILGTFFLLFVAFQLLSRRKALHILKNRRMVQKGIMGPRYFSKNTLNLSPLSAPDAYGTSAAYYPHDSNDPVDAYNMGSATQLSAYPKTSGRPISPFQMTGAPINGYSVDGGPISPMSDYNGNGMPVSPFQMTDAPMPVPFKTVNERHPTHFNQTDEDYVQY